MKIKRYLKKKSRLSTFALVFPSIAVAAAIIGIASTLYAVYIDNVSVFISNFMTMLIALAIAFPICGSAGLLCAILALRKLGRNKHIIAAIIWNGLTLALSIPLLYTCFNAFLGT